ncbi:MAG TPA: serine/threonine protein kinase [Thermoprotei archaeon]|nr:serine/threonine protein kinase [Thermoprotei archaeon]
MRHVVKAFKRLKEQDFRILNAIERGMAHYMYVPVQEVARLSNYSENYVLTKLKFLNSLGLVQRRLGAYPGFILTSRGYDCLALNALVKRGVLAAVTLKPIGVGKESDVFEGLTPSGRRVAVKFHRLGRTSFRKTRRYRAYIGERKHISWLYQARLAAEREYTALTLLFPHGVSVPEPISWNRHVVVTSIIEGIPLYMKPELSDPLEVFYSIIENISRAVIKAEVVHGDLSEYNVIVDSDENITIIDWPQWVSVHHPSANMLLKRDLLVLYRFFRSKYKLKDIGMEDIVKKYGLEEYICW